MRDWRKCIVSPETAIRKAVAVLDAAALQILLVLDAEEKLLGTVTDGDVRRALLRGIDFESPVVRIANSSPVTVRQDAPRDDVVRLMRARSVHHVPIVDDRGIVRGLASMEDALSRAELDNEVVLMAGGVGSRLRPLTDGTPKPMLRVGDRPILQTILQSFVTQGFRRFHISVNYQRTQIMQHFGDGSSLGAEIDYLEEDRPLGTAGALGLLPRRPALPFFVMNGDILTRVDFREMLDFHSRRAGAATMAVREFSMQVPYGVVEQDDAFVRRIIEKPVHRVFVNAGIYVIDPAALDQVPPGEPIDMPELLQALIEHGRPVCSFPVHEYWIDIGHKDDFHRAEADYREVFR